MQSPAIKELLKSPEVSSAINVARKRRPSDVSAEIAKLEKASGNKTKVLRFQDFQVTLNELRDQSSNAFKNGFGERGRYISGLREELLDEVENVVGEGGAEARRIWRQAVRLPDALADGRKAASRPGWEVRELAESITDKEARQAFNTGLGESIIDDLHGQTSLLHLTPKRQEHLRVIFDGNEEAYSKICGVYYGGRKFGHQGRAVETVDKSGGFLRCRKLDCGRILLAPNVKKPPGSSWIALAPTRVPTNI